jgi:hypothetical protein
MIVPSRLRSITACERAIAAILPASSMLWIRCAVMSLPNFDDLDRLAAAVG